VLNLITLSPTFTWYKKSGLGTGGRLLGIDEVATIDCSRTGGRLLGIDEVATIDCSRTGGRLLGIDEVATIDCSRTGGMPRLHGIPGV